jgi:hypothetical protein
MTWAIALTKATFVPGCTGRWYAASTCGRAHQLDPSRVRDDERRSVAQAPLDPRAEDRVGIGGVGADDEDDVGLVDRLEVLGAGRRAERLAEPIPGGGVADPSAGVDVVVAEGGPHHLLDDVDLLVGAPRRGDAADGVEAVRSWIARKPVATGSIAVSQDTTCQGSSMRSRTIGLSTRSRWAAYP